MISQYNYFRKLIIDEDFENNKTYIKLIQRYQIKRIVILMYYL